MCKSVVYHCDSHVALNWRILVAMDTNVPLYLYCVLPYGPPCSARLLYTAQRIETPAYTKDLVPRLAEYVTLADLVVEVRGMCEVKATRCTCCLGWSEPEQCHGIVSSL